MSSLYILSCSYYINHYTKTTSWEDPRERYKEIGKPTGKDNKENEVYISSVFVCNSYIILWKVVPLPNLQVASMRRELEAEQPGIRYSTEPFKTNSQKNMFGRMIYLQLMSTQLI